MADGKGDERVPGRYSSNGGGGIFSATTGSSDGDGDGDGDGEDDKVLSMSYFDSAAAAMSPPAPKATTKTTTVGRIASSSSDASSSSSSSSDGDDDDDSDAAPPRPAAAPPHPAAVQTFNENTPVDLLDVPVEGIHPHALFGPPTTNGADSAGMTGDTPNANAVDYFDDGMPPPMSSSRSPAVRRPSKQEYYDVLEMASSRLMQQQRPDGGDGDGDGAAEANDGSYIDIIEEQGSSSGNEAVRSKKKKKKKKKSNRKDRSNKGLRASKSSGDGDDEEGQQHVEGRRRSAVFQKLFPATMVERGSMRRKHTPTFSERDLVDVKGSRKGSGSGSNGNNDAMRDVEDDPNDDLPARWNPASLVAVAQSKRSEGKVDARGFYNNVKERADSAYEKVQGMVTAKNRDPEIPENYNLHSIGKSRRESYAPLQKKEEKKKRDIPLHRTESIVWGDESVLTAAPENHRKEEAAVFDRDGDPEAGIARENGGIEMQMVDDCSYSELSEANKNYLLNEQIVRKLRWQRKRRRLGILLIAAIAVFSMILAIFLTGGGDGNDEGSSASSLTPSNDHDDIDRNDPPSRPLPQAPADPTIDDAPADGGGLRPITLADLRYIVNEITSDASILNDPDSPQYKALEWARNDMQIYNVEVRSRVAQRYCLAALYYAANGTGWDDNDNWGNGHECEWYGVGCETGESNVVSVTYLDLNSNNLRGTIPPEIGYILSLEQIHLWGNSLVGQIPSTLSQLSNLHTLYLDNNRLEGEMADTFDQLTSLKHLDLSGNKLRGHIPHGLGSLINLRDLRLSNNLLSSTFPTSLISLSNLQTLLLDSNALSGSLPALVGEMRSLVTIRIHENDLKGELPSFSGAIYLEEAHFDGNYFSGRIPSFGSSRLRELYLGQNAFTGSIPESIGDLVKLEILSASSNKLDSTIPGSISNATTMQILDLSHNKLGGEIPLELSALTEMRELRMDHNRLRGFPTWLGSMKRLKIVHLNNNLLDGKLDLPLDVGDLDDLEEFTIENNDLTGVVGELMCDLLLDVLTSDCWGTPPQVDCPCCTKCY